MTGVQVRSSDFCAAFGASVQQPCSGGTSPYPGQRLAELVVELTTLLLSEELNFVDTNMYVKGWFTPYHRRRKVVNPLILQQIQHQATALLARVEPKVEAVTQEMRHLFPDSTAQEWIQQHVSAVLEPLQSLLEDVQVTIQEMLPSSAHPFPAGQ
ncbi:hypothetical protein MATL_G00006800 [Megalops atlanticus]|uniref:Uncharacterized protein n=1 Tax=Megalops atlanticus TaxID=7932 RepID=A0A9D3QKM7_MEGAT|nr:hypothetical protein MATL_G00006800 [Megalops atlanticus]